MSRPTAAAPAKRRRRTSGVLTAGLTLGLALALTGCGGGGTAPSSPAAAPSSSAGSPSGSATTSVSSSPSSSTGTSSSPAASSTPTTTAPSSAAAAPTTINLDQDLPKTGPNPTSYEGEPRLVADVHHLGCLEAQNADIPESEADVPDDTEELNITPVSMAKTTALAEGWKLCMVAAFESFEAPATFDLQPISGSTEENVAVAILDADGQQIGGYSFNPSRRSTDQELLEVISVEPMPEHSFTGSLSRYLRTLVVQGADGPVLLVDQVTAASEDEAKTLEAWTIGSSDWDQTYSLWAQVPLSSANAANDVVGTRLHEVLLEMVGSFQPSAQ